MLLNKLMDSYWEQAQGWKTLVLPPKLRWFLQRLSRNLETTAVEGQEEHVHLDGFGIRERNLDYGLLVFKTLSDEYRKLNLDKPLWGYISLDDGSCLDEESYKRRGPPFMDCTVHFHVQWKGELQWTEISLESVEKFIQPIMIVSSADSLMR